MLKTLQQVLGGDEMMAGCDRELAWKRLVEMKQQSSQKQQLTLMKNMFDSSFLSLEGFL